MSAEEFKAKGNAALQAKKFDEAIEMYTEAIKLDPSNQVFYSNRSAAYLSSGDAAAALADGEAAIGAKADWAKGYSRKGAALHALKKYDEAEAAYAAGLAAVPGDASLEAALKEVKEAAAKEAAKAAAPPNPFGNLMAKIAVHPKFGEWMSDPAMAQKIGMLQSNPNAALGQFMSDPTMHPVLEAALGFKLGGGAGDFAGGANGGGAMDLGEEDDDSDDDEGAVGEATKPKAPAAPAPKAAPAAAPKPRELSEEEKAAAAAAEMRAKGNAHYKNKEWADALECYDNVVALDPSQVAVLNNKAAVYMEMGDLDAAEKQCGDAVDAARALRPTPFELISKIFMRWGKVHVKRKDLATALEYYKKAKLEFSDKELERLIKTTELDKKKRDAKEYVNPELAEEAKARGNDAFRAQDWKTAINEYEDAIKRDPKNPAYHNNLAATLSKVMDFQGAKREVEKALDLDPKYVKAWSRKGDIEFLQKEYHKAMESYQKGLKFDDASKPCRDGLMKTMQQINASSKGASEDERKERAAHGMADPEIQAILSDPVVRQVIQDLSTSDPTAQAAGNKAMRDPVMGAKINKLIAAGVLQTG